MLLSPVHAQSDCFGPWQHCEECAPPTTSNPDSLFGETVPQDANKQGHTISSCQSYGAAAACRDPSCANNSALHASTRPCPDL
jgi:hypothetical protein